MKAEKNKIQRETVRRIMLQNFRKNRLQNRILILAVVLVTILMTVIFGAGVSLVHNVQQANELLQGTLANGFFPGAAEEEMEAAGDLKEVGEVGWQQYVAEAVLPEQLENNNLISMTAYDEMKWQEHILPTSSVKGEYPKAENEVMISLWTLERLGIDHPKSGMTVPIEFRTIDGETYRQDFILSGYYEDYIYTPGATLNSGNTMAANLYYSTNASSRRAEGNLVFLIGIPVGLLLGTVFAVLAVPALLEKLTAGNGYGSAFDTEIWISSFIYILAVLFTWITVRISSRKPAKMAAGVSLVEALRFADRTGRTKARRTGSGGKLYRLALRNVFRNRKRAVITFASLFFGLVVFFVIISSLFHISYEERYRRGIPDNFVITNLTFETDNTETIRDIFSSEVLDEIFGWDGVKGIGKDYVQYSKIVDVGDALTPYAEEQAMYRGVDRAEVQSDFRVSVTGLSIDKLENFPCESTLDAVEIRQKLEEGSGVLLIDNGESDYRKICGQKISLQDVTGAEVEYEVVGLLYTDSDSYEKNYLYYGCGYGYGTRVYTSEQGIRCLNASPVIRSLHIRSESEKDPEIQEQIADLFADTDAVMTESQLESKAVVDSGISMVRTAGMVLGGFLIFMGMLNFVNVIFTNIYSRQKELAALESIGMMQGQMKKTLILEGIDY